MRTCLTLQENEAMSGFSYNAIQQIEEVLVEKLGYAHIGMGRHRSAYRRRNYVVKVPLNMDGLADNWRERRYWLQHHRDGYITYARCRLIYNCFLVMEYARFPGLLSNQDGYIPMDVMPGWAYAVDCFQVGYNIHGKMVAYDYAG